MQAPALRARLPAAGALAATLRGVFQTFSVVAATIALGAGAHLALAGVELAPPLYTAPAMEAEGESEAADRWLVDGFNVLHAGVLRGRERSGWWREEARQRLLARASSFQGPASEILVVFDGAHFEPPGEAAARLEAGGAPPLRVVFAPSADNCLLRAVGEAPDPAHLVVVTADRRLADRARHRGARVVSPRAFLARCPAERSSS
jgi:predicted RNA-binding protein with PIN domain